MMMKKLTAWLLVLLAVATAAADRLPASPSIDDLGNLTVGKLALHWTRYAPDWRSETLQADDFKADAGFPRRSPGRVEISGKWNSFRIAISAVAAGNNGIAYTARFTAAPPVDTAALALIMIMPDLEAGDVWADGQKIVLPKEFERVSIFSRKVRSLRFGSGDRTVAVEGDFLLQIQDNRKWGSRYYEFRLGTTPVSGKIGEASIDLRIRVESPRTAPIDLKEAFNMGFRDETPNDGKGGWTDQGPATDLRMMKPGKLSAFGVDFDIVDPERNGGRSCLVLSSGQKKFPAEKRVVLDGAGGEFRYLYLLHASAWTPAQMPIGTIIAEYADGRTKEITVHAGRDVGNWWPPCSFENGAVAWTGEKEESVVGLYLSQFSVGTAPSRLTFKAADGSNAVWMIVGAALGDRRRISGRSKLRRILSRERIGCRSNTTAIPQRVLRSIFRSTSTHRPASTVRSLSPKTVISPSVTRRKNEFGSSALIWSAHRIVSTRHWPMISWRS